MGRRRTHAYAVYSLEHGWLGGSRLDIETWEVAWVSTREAAHWFDTIDQALEACRDGELALGGVNVIPVPR